MEFNAKRPRLSISSVWSSWISSKPTSTILVFSSNPDLAANDTIPIYFQQLASIKIVETSPDGLVTIIDFNNLLDIVPIVDQSRHQPLIIGSEVVQLEYCLHKLCNAQEASCVGSVLRLDITNATFPITVKALQAACQSITPLTRILIGPKTLQNPNSPSVSALLEVETNANAKILLEGLNNQALYTGCCIIHATFSALPLVPVSANDNALSWDYSQPNLSQHANGGKFGLLGGKPSGDHLEGISNHSNNGNHSFLHQSMQPINPYAQTRPNMPPPDFSSFPIAPPMAMRMPTFYAGEGTTIFFNGVNMDKFNCDRLFNLVSLYGNVARIKFIVKRPGVALVQMGTPDEGRHLLTYLSGLFVFGRQVHLVVSKDKQINEGREACPPLEDGTPSIKNYTSSHNNRYRQASHLSKSRLSPPTSTLHFFNAPLNMTEETIRELFIENGATQPSRISVFPVKEGQKSSLGLVEFPVVHEAVEALVLSNNHVLKDANSQQAFHLKLAFSAKPIKIFGRKRSADEVEEMAPASSDQNVV